MPNPPSFFEVQMSFQALRHKLLEFDSSLIPVQQKFLIMVVIFAMNFFEKRILDM
jgi:hypothetical protein